ncbi:hypothetical protein O181_040207 [Austropuccinia psidii MF-1]|uniref:Uncharacterized protein n=1 Tax=Austropuccinia psidii MF-1 TaxID=1389203 RepID=A0A9Q3DIB8_9BASI|nr:hypothetical protein [Austropuccinia psidii MF-1]
MSVSTHSKKEADNDTDDKPLSNEEVYSLLNSLKSEVMYLKSAHTSDAAKLQSLDSTNYPEWVASLNRVLCIAFNSDVSSDDSPSLLNNQTPCENRAISHFIDATLPADFALCIRIMPLHATLKEFFDAIKARFALLKKLGIEAKELEGLLAQAACHVPPTLDQLITAVILSKGKEKPSSTFVGQVILNTSQTRPEAAWLMSPFVYRMSNPPESASAYPWPKSPYHGRKVTSASNMPTLTGYFWFHKTNNSQPPTITGIDLTLPPGESVPASICRAKC